MTSCNCKSENPSYIFGSAIITIVIGSLAFITALAWNSFIQQTFEEYTNKNDELKARLSYAFAVTFFSLILAFIVMYYIEGDKW